MTNPFQHAKRRKRTALEMAQIFADGGGRCHICKRKLGPADRWELDHIIPLAKGGTDDDANCAPACDWCHDKKSDADNTSIAAGKRKFAKHFVPSEHRRSKSWGRR